MRSLVRWLNWMTEKSAASEACFPSFPTIPTPERCCQTKPVYGERDPGLTNVGSLDHANVVPSVSDTTHTFLGMLPDEASDISLLGRRTSACDYGGELGSNLYELIRE